MVKYYEEPHDYGWTRYHVVGNPLPQDRGYNEAELFQERPMGTVSIEHRQFVPNFDEHGVSEDYRRHVEQQAEYRGEDPYADSHELPDPKTLFSETPPMVYGTASHSSMRHAMPTLLAHVYNKHGRLQADYSLSRYSAPLVQRAIKAGFAEAHPANPTAEVSNNIGFRDRSYLTTQADVDSDIKKGNYREIPQEDIKRARGVIKNMLRPQRKHTNVMSGPQFEQERIPGVDW